MPILDPNTRRRLSRFKEIGRARWAFRILIAIFVLSLLSDFIANDKPLVVKSNGSLFFPIFRFWGDHTEMRIVGSGGNARAKYKDLEQSAHFEENEENWMIWPPIRFGANESLASSDVEPAFAFQMLISPSVRVASLDISPEFQIARSRGGAAFAENLSDNDLRDQPLESLITVSDPIREAIQVRLENKAAPAAAFPANESGSIELAFTEYRPRSRPPRTVRASLRDSSISGAKAERAKMREDLTFYRRNPASWNNYDESSRQAILAAAK
ncbi:MAG: hypothetical protein HKN23_21845, partial [Verrucomicrobiales bacterium]|nr:hypothetical protein [Verrucomicrobiales bacterium]